MSLVEGGTDGNRGWSAGRGEFFLGAGLGGVLQSRGGGPGFGGTPRLAGGKEIQGKESALRAASEGFSGPDPKRKLGTLQAAQPQASRAQKGIVLERKRGFLTRSVGPPSPQRGHCRSCPD